MPIYVYAHTHIYVCMWEITYTYMLICIHTEYTETSLYLVSQVYGEE